MLLAASSSPRNFSASSAAMQPEPGDVSYVKAMLEVFY